MLLQLAKTEPGGGYAIDCGTQKGDPVTMRIKPNPDFEQQLAGTMLSPTQHHASGLQMKAFFPEIPAGLGLVPKKTYLLVYDGTNGSVELSAP